MGGSSGRHAADVGGTTARLAGQRHMLVGLLHYALPCCTKPANAPTTNRSSVQLLLHTAARPARRMGPPKRT